MNERREVKETEGTEIAICYNEKSTNYEVNR